MTQNWKCPNLKVSKSKVSQNQKWPTINSVPKSKVFKNQVSQNQKCPKIKSVFGLTEYPWSAMAKLQIKLILYLTLALLNFSLFVLMTKCLQHHNGHFLNMCHIYLHNHILQVKEWKSHVILTFFVVIIISILLAGHC